jgi:hypothetical protein
MKLHCKPPFFDSTRPAKDGSSILCIGHACVLTYLRHCGLERHERLGSRKLIANSELRGPALVKIPFGDLDLGLGPALLVLCSVAEGLRYEDFFDKIYIAS